MRSDLPEGLQSGHRRSPLTTTHTGGRILSGFMLPWFRVAPPRAYGVITTVGRRSGRTRRRCVRVVRAGSCAYLVAIPGARTRWLKNIEARPEVGLRVPGGSFRGIARVVDGTECDEAKRVFCGVRSWADRGSYVLHYRGMPTRSRVQDMWERIFDSGTPLVVELANRAVRA
jgi:deazaflavin-dependent oxidoreductase (nitroreductase family)